jgi:hypothetical protein
MSKLHKHLLVLLYLTVALSFSHIAFHLVAVHIKWKDFFIYKFNRVKYMLSAYYILYWTWTDACIAWLE